MKVGSHVKWSMPEDVIESDVDARARAMLRTLDQAVVNKIHIWIVQYYMA